MRWSNFFLPVLIVTVLAGFGIGAFFYNSLPDKIAVHWGADGMPNGYADKAVGVFLTPAISIVLLAVLVFIPRLDPLHGIEKFGRDYQKLVLLLGVFFLYLQALTISSNLGVKFNFIQPLSPAIGILFFMIGTVLAKAKQNWFVGIRTPWTLSSESVWNKTHSRGSRLFKAAGVIASLGVFFPQQAIWFILVPVLAASVYLVVYSYLEYRKEN